ncbi:MAG: DUF445 domain-containing protein, partial [Alphaproteobacteria bacterium]|nr:DUF445 domain-containing protein [Alphaproteobacteria bacterium]
ERAEIEAKLAALRRMRLVATLLLVAMAALFIATSYGKAYWPWLAYVRAFAEAGVVGACADWFAVVALFRHPLGIPIPHTAIVPRNKARIAGAMGRFVTNNFLTPQVLSRRLANVRIGSWATDWLSRPHNAGRVARMVALAVPEVVRLLPREELSAFLRDSVRRGLIAMPAAPVASHLLAIVWAHGQTQALIDRGLDLLEASLASNKDVIRRKLEAGSSRWIPRWVDHALADKMFVALMATLTEMRDPAHPWRLELKASVESLIERLNSDPELMAEVEAAKSEAIATPLFDDQLRALWSEIEQRLPDDAGLYTERIAAATDSAVTAAVRWLQDNPAVQERLDRWMRYVIKRTIVPRRTEIGSYVTQVVEAWDATTLVSRMEQQVGRDLQYIRINGTLVGGLVGLTIYLLSGWLLPG